MVLWSWNSYWSTSGNRLHTSYWSLCTFLCDGRLFRFCLAL